MAGKKIFVVFGATSNQGGSVINAVLGDSKTANEFQIRGITRDPSKPKAKALEARGVECVAADINNKEQIKSAFQGAYAVFAMTDYWEKMDAELECNKAGTLLTWLRYAPQLLMVGLADPGIVALSTDIC